VNEYTRREEVRWTLLAAAALVVCIGCAIVLLMTAQGNLVPDPAARAAAKQAEAAAAQLRPCVVAAEKLITEIDVLQTSAKAARLGAEPDAGASDKRGAKKSKDKEPDVELAWGTAQPSHRQAKALAACRPALEAAAGAKADAAPGWAAVEQAAAIASPAEGDRAAQVEAARKLLAVFEQAPINRVVTMAMGAEQTRKRAAEEAAKHADTAQVREALAPGLLSRELAIVVGVGLSLAGLLVSFLSVRVVSMRRLSVLLPLRRAPQRGYHAAAILKLAAQPNGGEPGLVTGAAVGGLLAAGLRPTDADLFVIGVMGGLLVGLLLQWGVRVASGVSRFRPRAAELGDTEKPAVPIVLVLSGIAPGVEPQFLDYFGRLGPSEAAQTVEKLAAQAEERILAAAEAGSAGISGYPGAARSSGGFPGR
jgi:hypothetical protein